MTIISIIKRFRNITWLDQTQCDVLIYDSEGSDLVQSCIPSQAKVNVLRTREGLPLIKSARFIGFFLRNALKFRNLGLALVVSVLEVWKPKVILTFIDNSPAMGKIKQIFPGMLVISVQNGTRWDLSSPTQPHLDFDQYFSFGAVEKDIFSQGGHFAMQVSPIGSIRAGIFKEKFSVPHEKKFDICFISQFTQPYTNVPDQWWHELISTYSETEKQLFSIVTDFVEKNNLKFCIAMRCSLDTPEFKDECRYFPLSEKTQIVRIPQNKFSSYKAVQASRLSVTISSTLGYEAMGLGERVIFAKDIKSVASVVMGGWTKNLVTHRLPELQRLYSLNYDEFNSKAIELLNMKDTEYLDYSKEARAYYMNIDLEHLPQEIIKNKIERFLS